MWGVGVPGSGPQGHCLTGGHRSSADGPSLVREMLDRRQLPPRPSASAPGPRRCGRRVRPHAPAWLTGPRGPGARRAGGRWAPSLAAPLFPPGLASVLLSLLSLVYLSQVLPQKLILTKDSHRIRVSLRSGLGQDAPQWHPGCLCPRPTVQNN